MLISFLKHGLYALGAQTCLQLIELLTAGYCS